MSVVGLQLDGRIRAVLALLVTSAVAGCASLQIGSDHDREVSFQARETYDWVAAPEDESGEGEDIERVNPFFERRLQRAVEHELDTRGFRKVMEGEVDLLLSVAVLGAEEATRGTGGGSGFPLLVGFSFGYSPTFFYPGYGFGYGGYGYGGYGVRRGFRGYSPFGLYRPYFGYAYGSRAYSPYGYYGGSRTGDLVALAPGTFVVDVLDGESGDLIWRGWANGALAHAPAVEDLPEFIASVVQDIMEDFPPDSS